MVLGIVLGGPIVVLAVVLAVRDLVTRRRGGSVDYLSSRNLDAQQARSGQIMQDKSGFSGGEIMPPTDP